jgi:hypothetical protein
LHDSLSSGPSWTKDSYPSENPAPASTASGRSVFISQDQDRLATRRPFFLNASPHQIRKGHVSKWFDQNKILEVA